MDIESDKKLKRHTTMYIVYGGLSAKYVQYNNK